MVVSDGLGTRRRPDAGPRAAQSASPRHPLGAYRAPPARRRRVHAGGLPDAHGGPSPAPAPEVGHAVNLWPPIAAVGLHTLSHLLVAGLIALVVYEKLGLSLLRRTWFNLDYLWAGALVAAGVMAALL